MSLAEKCYYQIWKAMVISYRMGSNKEENSKMFDQVQYRHSFHIDIHFIEEFCYLCAMNMN